MPSMTDIRRSHRLVLRQGLGYSGDSAAKVLTKFCTPNSVPKNSGLAPSNSSLLKLSNHV